MVKIVAKHGLEIQQNKKIYIIFQLVEKTVLQFLLFIQIKKMIKKFKKLKLFVLQSIAIKMMDRSINKFI